MVSTLNGAGRISCIRMYVCVCVCVCVWTGELYSVIDWGWSM
jgi:hypothetical protein